MVDLIKRLGRACSETSVAMLQRAGRPVPYVAVRTHPCPMPGNPGCFVWLILFSSNIFHRFSLLKPRSRAKTNSSYYCCMPIHGTAIHLCSAEKKQSSLITPRTPPTIPIFLFRCHKFNADSNKSPLAAAFPFLESTEACAIPFLHDSSRLQGVLQVCLQWSGGWLT